MNYRNGVITGIALTLLLGAAGWAAWALLGAKAGEGKAAPPAVPATVPKPFKEDQATTLTLTPEAEERLKIQLGTVERKSVPRKRAYGSEVTVPPGRSVIVSAPVAGLLRAAPGVSPAAGLTVKKGQPLLELAPLLDPVGRANLLAVKTEAEGQVINAGEQFKAAKVALERAKKVLEGGAGRQRDVDEAQAQVDIAQKLVETATARRNLLNKVTGEVESGTTTAIVMEAPEDGLIRVVSALPGQTVPSGAALFEVMNLDRIWVRVPVYVGDLPEIDTAQPAEVGGLTARPGSAVRPAKPAVAPPTANAVAGTVDLFFDLENRESGHRPGERLGATLLLRDPAKSLTVPWSAVVWDVYGGAWVYEKAGDHAYARRRVVVRYVKDDTAVLESGPAEGTKIVTVGTEELFGTDAGFSK